jgi:uncharacterized GH25 family protein
MKITPKKSVVALLLVFVLTSAVMAHEFWMQPLKYFFAVGEKIVVSIKVGENFLGEGWNLRKDRLVRLKHYALAKEKDLTSTVVEGTTDHFTAEASIEGSNVIVMESNPAFIELEAEKFNEYLKEDGLDDAFNLRVKNDQVDQAGRELYSRHTKLLIQVGEKKTDDWKRVYDLPLEIMPEQNPADLKVGQRISFRMLWEGKPLFGAKVRVWNRYKNRTTMQPIFSQQDGRIETTVSNPGAWMVSVVKMVPSKDPKADWRSYWGSLTFGVR